MYINSKSRRQFLVGSARTLVALPFLPSLWPREAWGQAIPIQKRFIGSWVPLGGYSNADLYPTYTADQASVFPQSGHNIYSTNLRISPEYGSISKIYSSKLNPFLPKLTLLRGLDCPLGHDHGEATQLGQMRYPREDGYGDPNLNLPEDTMIQYPAVPFIDQFLAYSPEFYSSIPLVRSVVGYGSISLGQVTPGNLSSGVKGVFGPDNPVALFNLLFGPSTPSVSATGPTPAQTESKTLIDQTLSDLKSILSHRNISSTDKQRLDAFTTELFETQKKLNIVSAAICSAPPVPTKSASMGEIATNIDREVFLDLYTSVLAAGIKCGRTSVATLAGIMAVETQGTYSFANLHSWGHDSKTAEVGDAMRWFVDKAIVPLITKLDVDEGGGSTFLDNSLIMFGNTNSASVHRNWDRNILLAGGAGGYFKTGQFVDYRQPGVFANYGQPGILYNQLIITILKSMGIKDSNPYLNEYAKADLIVPSTAAENWWSTLRKDNGQHPHKDVIRESRNLLPLIVK